MTRFVSLVAFDYKKQIGEFRVEDNPYKAPLPPGFRRAGGNSLSAYSEIVLAVSRVCLPFIVFWVYESVYGIAFPFGELNGFFAIEYLGAAFFLGLLHGKSRILFLPFFLYCFGTAIAAYLFGYFSLTWILVGFPCAFFCAIPPSIFDWLGRFVRGTTETRITND